MNESSPSEYPIDDLQPAASEDTSAFHSADGEAPETAGSSSDPAADENEPDRHSAGRGIDLSRVQRELERRAETVKRAELEEALSELKSRGGLTDEQRRVVTTLADTLAHELVADPKLAATRESRREPATVRTIVRLFDLDDV